MVFLVIKKKGKTMTLLAENMLLVGARQDQQMEAHTSSSLATLITSTCTVLKKYSETSSEEETLSPISLMMKMISLTEVFMGWGWG